MSPRCRIVYALYLGGHLSRVDILTANHYREIMLYKGVQRLSYKNLINTTLNVYFATLSNASNQTEWYQRLDTISAMSQKIYAIDIQDVQYLNHLNNTNKLTESQMSLVDVFKILDAAGVIDDETDVF